MSIGVHNIGYGVVRLLEHREEYISTFPNGYGRDRTYYQSKLVRKIGYLPASEFICVKNNENMYLNRYVYVKKKKQI